jgi:hypothetical protein
MPHIHNLLIRKYKFVLKMALAHESGNPGVLFAKKNKCKKSRETVPLITGTVVMRQNRLQSRIIFLGTGAAYR